LQASIVPAFLQGQGRELFKGAQHLLYFHASKNFLQRYEEKMKKTIIFLSFNYSLSFS